MLPFPPNLEILMLFLPFWFTDWFKGTEEGRENKISPILKGMHKLEGGILASYVPLPYTPI